MNSSQLFCITGVGYLEGISLDQDKLIADIRVINNSCQDEVCLDAEIQGFSQEYLLNLLMEVGKGKSVIVSFKAVYRQLKASFSCIDPESKDQGAQIVKLSGKIVEIDRCYINGSLVSKSHFRYLNAA